jgi:copper(I)-binding protein
MTMATTINTAAFLTITNSGATSDFLISASAAPEIVKAVELHTMIEEGGVMKMRPVEKIEVPANGEAVLKPGSFHVMFIGVQKELKDGDTVKLSLTFEKAGTIQVDAVVRTPPTP